MMLQPVQVPLLVPLVYAHFVQVEAVVGRSNGGVGAHKFNLSGVDDDDDMR